MNGLSLCSGIGGLDLGLSLALEGYRTICYVEGKSFCQEILLARMADGVLDRAPIWGDLRQFDGRPWHGLVDLVHGGYPCQPFSVAGKRSGTNDPRHLWPDIKRIIGEIKPEWCFFENVAGHLTLGFDEVAQSLEAMGYRVAAGLFTAAEVDASHRRQRLFVLANAASSRRKTETANFTAQKRPADSQSDDARLIQGGLGGSCGSMGRPNNPRLEGWGESERQGANELPPWPPGPEERDRWVNIIARWPALAPAVADTKQLHIQAPQSSLRRMADGHPRRVDRLKALGNAVVPTVAALAWRTLRKQL